MTRLGSIVQEFVDLMEWPEEVDVDEARGIASLRARVLVDDQPCTLIVATNDTTNAIDVHLYLPFHVREAKRTDASVVVNAINHAARRGHLEMDPTDGELRFVHSVDLEFCTFSAAAVQRITDMAVAVLADWMAGLAEVAITPRDAAGILARGPSSGDGEAQGADQPAFDAQGHGPGVTVH